MTPAEVNRLVEAARHGDTQAFAALVQEHQGAIFGLVSRFARDVQVAEELTQDTFLKAFRGLDRFRGDSKFSTWLYRIAVNVCRDYHSSQAARARRHESSLDAPESPGYKLEDHGQSPHEVVASVELTESFLSCLESLEAKYKTVFVLRHQEGLSYDDIAGALDISVTNAKVRAHRAREMILKELRARGHEL